MEKEMRSAADEIRWSQESNHEKGEFQRKGVKPLPLSEEDYKRFSFLLATFVLHDGDAILCDKYFELQSRAYYGNGYARIKELEEIEKQMWSLSTGEGIENNKSRRSY